MSDRQLAAVIAGLFGAAVMGGITAQEIAQVIDHFAEHREEYLQSMRIIREQKDNQDN